MWYDEVIGNETFDAQKVGAGFKQLESGVYSVVVDRCFIRKTDSGAEMFEVTFKTKDDQTVDFATCVRGKSGKNTYTDKEGKERPLPAFADIAHFGQAMEIDVMKLNPMIGKLEYGFGSNAKTIDAKIFADLRGKQLKIGVQQYEDEYNGNINVKLDVFAFMKLDGTNKDGENIEEKAVARVEKTPLRKLKPDTKSKQENITVDPVLAANGWGA